MARSPAAPSPCGGSADAMADSAGTAAAVADAAAPSTEERSPGEGEEGRAAEAAAGGGADEADELGICGWASRNTPATARTRVVTNSRRGERGEDVVIAAVPLRQNQTSH